MQETPAQSCNLKACFPAGCTDPMTAWQLLGPDWHAGMPARLHAAVPAVRTESRRTSGGGQPEVAIGCA